MCHKLKESKTVVYNKINGNEQCETCVWYDDVEAVMDKEVRDLSYIIVMNISHLNCNFASHSANSEARNWHVSALQNWQTAEHELRNDADTVSFVMLRMVAALLLLWPLISYGFVLLSFPAAGSAATSRQFQLGAGYSYRLESTVLLNEAGPRIGKDVGYLVTGTLSVGVLWQSPYDPNDKLLQLQVSVDYYDRVFRMMVILAFYTLCS